MVSFWVANLDPVSNGMSRFLTLIRLLMLIYGKAEYCAKKKDQICCMVQAVGLCDAGDSECQLQMMPNLVANFLLANQINTNYW